MIERLLPAGRPVTLALLLCAGPAGAADIMPHQALYTMTLIRAGSDSGVTAAHGTMAYKWGETCGGWTIEQNYRLVMGYADSSSDVAITSNFVTWESKDGLQYRFNQNETRNDTGDEEIRGVARLEGPGQGGVAIFEKPAGKRFVLPPGTLFPSAHTILLIDRAKAGDTFIARQVFDGTTVSGAALVSTVIGPKIEPDAAAATQSPLVNHSGWRMRLAFFPADQQDETPDYELGMLLLDNGVSRDMVIDYGDYAIRAKLDDIEPAEKPRC
ncbi:MAG TPA: cell envelope integrity EipB family protein [Stellaceae bacterium]|nr:cell envelope integrity EipB family protein [Stellaceae bacterium]